MADTGICVLHRDSLSSGDAYSSRLGEILVDLLRLNRLIDDTLMHDPTIEESFHHTFEFLNTCAKHSVTLNPQKFKFCRKEVDFAGYTLGWDKFFLSNETLSTISNFRMPQQPSISDIRAWFGLVNQISPFFAATKVMEPFRELLKHTSSTKKIVFWDERLQELFETSKQTICNEISNGLSYFNILKPIIVNTD